MSATETSLESNGGGVPQANGGADPYVTDFTIYRQWPVLPGRTLGFKVSIALSGDLAATRERTIGLDEGQRAANLLDFRTRLLADVLLEPPTGFPDFPETVDIGGTPSTKLSDRAYVFFSRRDSRGGYFFQFLIEDLIREYWGRVLPLPYFPEAKADSTSG